jgi:hypothetical protein
MKKYLLVAALLLLAPTIASAQCLLTTETEAIPGFFVGQPVNFQIVAVSGTEPYRFEIHSGALPEGLHLTPNGKIVGVPRSEGTSTVLILISDAAGCSLGQTYEITVLPADQAP